MVYSLYFKIKCSQKSVSDYFQRRDFIESNEVHMLWEKDF
ncbi:hypothetical protein J2T50_000270 [Streptococcus gallinaceus]|nr:hypothetical protein [Streptococcus gallinaceus]MCP1769336.1 hypothetical protein [Streptococcus gallinaceus]